MHRPVAVHSRPRLDLLDPFEVSKLGGLEVITEGVVEGFLSGLHRSPRRGFSVEFAEHRMYQPGDELRYVDWKILGRNDRLYVKQFEEETNLRAMLVCDASRSMAWTGSPDTVLPKLAYAQRLIAALSLILLRQRDATGLITFDDDVRSVLPPRARLSHWRQLLATLGGARGRAGDRRGAGAPSGSAASSAGAGSWCSSPTCCSTAISRSRRCGSCATAATRSLVLHIMDPGEVTLGRTGRGAVRGSRESRAAVVLRPRDWAGAYRETVRAVVADWRLACRRHGIAYHRVTTDTPYGIVLREALAPSSRAA